MLDAQKQRRAHRLLLLLMGFALLYPSYDLLGFKFVLVIYKPLVGIGQAGL